jgi:hypothetical protein
MTLRPLLAAMILLLALRPPVLAADTYVVICQTQPPTAGLTATLTSPGGVVKTAITGPDGAARIYYIPNAGTYACAMEGSDESYQFAALPELTLTFALAVTATPTRTLYPTITSSPSPTWTPRATPPAMPSDTPVPTATPLPTMVYLVWRFDGEIVLMPTAGVWTLSLTIQESPVNYTDTLSLLLRAMEAAQ